MLGRTQVSKTSIPLVDAEFISNATLLSLKFRGWSLDLRLGYRLIRQDQFPSGLVVGLMLHPGRLSLGAKHGLLVVIAESRCYSMYVANELASSCIELLIVMDL